MPPPLAYLLLTLSGPAAWWVLLQISDSLERMTRCRNRRRNR